jgi:hypothetical protein
MFRNFVETSSLYETNNPAEMDLITWGDSINANPLISGILKPLNVRHKH